jgi:hypothetical protein
VGADVVDLGGGDPGAGQRGGHNPHLALRGEDAVEVRPGHNIEFAETADPAPGTPRDCARRGSRAVGRARRQSARPMPRRRTTRAARSACWSADRGGRLGTARPPSSRGTSPWQRPHRGDRSKRSEPIPPCCAPCPGEPGQHQYPYLSSMRLTRSHPESAHICALVGSLADILCGHDFDLVRRVAAPIF